MNKKVPKKGLFFFMSLFYLAYGSHESSICLDAKKIQPFDSAQGRLHKAGIFVGQICTRKLKEAALASLRTAFLFAAIAQG
jgi:hypothetical protein